jgi:hypothetical protein
MNKVLFFLLSIFLISFDVTASQLVKDKIYSTHMKKYSKYRKCIKFTAETFNLPEMLLLAVLKTEGGTMGQCNIIKSKKNKVMNNTKDCGPMQINTVRSAQIENIGMSYSEVTNSACKNIVAGGFILAYEINKSGDFWSGVGNYHYHKSGPAPRHHYKYINLVYKNWQSLLK